MKTKKFLYDQELTHSFTKMNGIKIIDSFAKMFCPHTNWQNGTKAGRTNSKTNCQQNRIAISFLHAYAGLLVDGFDDNGVCLSKMLYQKITVVGVCLPCSSARII